MPPARPKAVLAAARFAETAPALAGPSARITALRPTGRGGLWARVEVDGVEAGEIPVVVASDLALASGRLWSEDLAIRAVDAAWERVALDGAMRLISVRARSRDAYRRRMAQRGYRPDAVESALDRAESLGLINEAGALADAIERERRRGYGVPMIRRRLSAQGFDEDAIRRALESQPPAEDAELAIALAVQWAGVRADRLEPSVARRRLIGYLGRRGFFGDDARRAVETALKPEPCRGP